MPNPWLIAMIAYLACAMGTLTFALWPLIRGVHLHPGGSSFDESKVFTERAKLRLTQNFSRIEGTLAFWKNRAEFYKRLHYYSVCWTIPSSVSMPFLVQASTGSPYSKWLLTAVSAHTAMILAFHRSLKVDASFRAFRQGESDFYDLYRRMLDRPTTFGSDEQHQLDKYFDRVENLRKHIRNVELENLPSIEQATSQLAHEEPMPSKLEGNLTGEPHSSTVEPTNPAPSAPPRRSP